MSSTTHQPLAFTTVPNDLLHVQQYTLANGLRLYLSVNTNAPRVFTNIVVRSGSKQDPPETTGLAHYMEHMLFKGTSRIGTLDWEKEKVLLERISDLYEQHRQATSEENRREIYREIDRVSQEAAKLAAPSEYDKLASAIGAKSTNAYTWLEQTVYVNDIPSNELERWMELESERFSMLALRLFHTELETVYEEFNINQDRDFRKVNNLLRAELFPRHPYGTQTTIGKAEHLRNPSHVNIQRYFQTYYVPNNMALVMAGDFDPQEVVALAERYFGHYPTKPIPPFTFEDQPPTQGPVRREVWGQESPFVQLGWRLQGAQGDDPLLLSLVQHLLYNQQAGLLDLNLNQQQRVLESEAWTWFHADYSAFGLYGKPREGQTLEEVEALMLAEVDRLRRGDFPDWLLEAVVTDFRLGDIRGTESNEARVGAMTQSFILGIPWERFTHRIDWMAGVTKQQLVDYANRFLTPDAYVVVYKHQGEDTSVIKVEKPPITPVDINRDVTSAYAQQFLEKAVPALDPVYADFSSTIRKDQLASDIPFHYVHNPDNPLFRLDYIFEMGKSNDRKFALALVYLPYLGTDRYSPAELQQEFFKLGLTFDVNNNDERSYVTMTGLESSFAAGLELMEHILAHVQVNAEAFQNVITDILTKRENARQDRGFILNQALSSYARYGSDSPFSFRLSSTELQQTDPAELINWIRQLTSYEHTIYYYGQQDPETVQRLLNQHHQVPAERRVVPEARKFKQLDTPQHEVIFYDFPIVQTDVLLLSKGTPQFNLEEHLLRELYNEYFGYGLSSIVFQEIRESKALAYSTYAFYTSPRKKQEAHYLQAYVGTQPDKLADALPALLQIMEHMPVVGPQIEHARQSILKRIESERIAPSSLYWAARATQDLGYTHDLRRDLYERMSRANPQELLDFQRTYVQGRPFKYIVLGSRERIDMDYLSTFGPVREMQPDEVFFH